MILEQFKGYLIGGIGILLTISLAANFGLYEALEDANKAAATAVERERTANGAAVACNASITELQEAATARETAAAPAVEQAKVEEQHAGTRAQVILATAPSAPDNDCASAKNMAETWLKGRKR